jgi:cytochrome c5
MANQGGGSFEEPKATAATAATASAPQADTAADTAAAAQAASAVAAATATAAAPATPATEAKPAASGDIPPLYAQNCQACHGSGLAGAPKLGDKAAWAPRLAQGIDGLTASAIKGKGAMPPRGGSTASDAEVKAVVTYMVGTVQ